MSHQKIVYLAGSEVDQMQVNKLAKDAGCMEYFFIERRGIELGWIGVSGAEVVTESEQANVRWGRGASVILPGAVATQLDQYEGDMEHSYALIDDVHDGKALVQSMEDNGFFQRLPSTYQFIGGFSDESDMQGIEQLEFEALEGKKVLADNLWMKASWLSFDDEDASLRFRFSYGREGLEDVARDYQREKLTAELAQAIFPESKAITDNAPLVGQIAEISNVQQPAFVERIYYFNAPNGGAQFHHDVERGHDGVVYAQMFGTTAWLALSKPDLLNEIIRFASGDNIASLLEAYFSSEELSELLKYITDRQFWSDCLDNRDSEIAERFLNQIPEFFAFLIDAGYACILRAGDVILLPQAGTDDCCWHSVFCLDDFPGEALSFAIRESA